MVAVRGRRRAPGRGLARLLSACSVVLSARACWNQGERDTGSPPFFQLPARCPDFREQFARGVSIVCDADCGLTHPRLELPVVAARDGSGRKAICPPFDPSLDQAAARALGFSLDGLRRDAGKAQALSARDLSAVPARHLLEARRIQGSVIPAHVSGGGADRDDVGHCLFPEAIALLNRRCSRDPDCRAANRRLNTPRSLRGRAHDELSANAVAHAAQAPGRRGP